MDPRFQDSRSDGKEYHASLYKISDNPAEVIPDADIVFICLPGYAIREELEKIKPYVSDNTIVGCIWRKRLLLAAL